MAKALNNNTAIPPTMPPKNGYMATCSRCGYEWRLKGRNKTNPPVSCPSCKARSDYRNPSARCATKITVATA